MRKHSLTLAILLTSLLMLPATIFAAGGPKAKVYTADLSAVNRSGVDGTATFTLDGNQLKVMVHATGLTPSQQHPMHLHGFEGNNRNAACKAAKDQNDDGLLGHHEAEAAIGGAVLPLDPFPTANAQGEVHFEHTYTVDPKEIGPLQNLAVALHGMNVKGTYKAETPVACAQVRPDTGPKPTK